MRLSGLMITVLWVAQTVVAQDYTKLDLQPVIDESRNLYQIVPADDASATMKNLTVLRWANNARGSQNGATLIWTHKGRPEAVCCIYPWGGSMSHEFDSLSRGKIRGMREAEVVWRPAEVGLKFADIPGAAAPMKTAARRKLQLSKLAREFRGTMTGWKVDDSDREELRLLPRELYRYKKGDPRIIDGALYAFVQGTDPEILLLIEAWAEKDQSAKWQYAFARRTSGGLEGRHKGKVVWTAKKHPPNYNPTDNHISFREPIDPSALTAD